MEIKPCPVCGHTDIQVKKEIIKKYEFGDNQIRVYAICPFCQHRGLSSIGRMAEVEGIEKAYQLWNDVR